MTEQTPGGDAAGRAALGRFSPVVRDWFDGAFAAPTPAQSAAWEAIGRGEDTLVVAPTGSGKTLSAFLSAIDHLVTRPAPESPARRCSVLYLSPLKALAVDVERNLRSPLAGIGAVAAREGLTVPDITVAVRSGDTPSTDRRAFARDGADILITTPESLFLLLTSRAREMLSGIDTVIIDEVHAVASTKRGAHLAVSLERLDALVDRPVQRIGLSATVRPIEEIARFLSGGRPVTVVNPPGGKVIDVEVVVPVPDLTALGAESDDLTGPAAGARPRTSIWPHVEERIVDLITEHRSSIVFANSRRLAERLTARLNEIYAERNDLQPPEEPPGVTNYSALPGSPLAMPRSTVGAVIAAGSRPAVNPGQSGSTAGAPPVLARAHHGSVSREQRAMIEHQLKTGALPAVVATSSLELGIDMGAVDLVIQVEAPPSVSSGLQRIGRAGHQVGAPSHGVMFPKFRGDLISAAVVAGRMRDRQIESMKVIANPLDILAQQIVAIVAMDEITVADLHQLIRRAAPFDQLGAGALDAVLDMLSGRYPSEQFAELRPRINWDRLTGLLSPRPGAQRLAVTSGGTIPDRGLFGVFLAAGDEGGAGRRVGELDEEMVYESRVGDVFALGSSSWRIMEITHEKVLVLPAPGLPGRLPFWRGDTLGRPAELGRAHGEFVREISALPAAAARERLTADGLDTFATDNLLTYLQDQRQATGVLPDERTLVAERFTDELGDWRMVIHSPWGAAVHAPWAMLISARMRERFGADVQAMHADDGIVLRLPDSLNPDKIGDLTELLVIDPDLVTAEVTREIGGAAVFASRFRECAARALLLPRRQIGGRQPLWQQRQRAASLLEVAAEYPTFPIVAEAVRECLSDVFDVPALVELMRSIAARTIKVVEVTTAAPSPFAGSLMFGYVAQFIYEGDSPLAERRAAALTVDPALLAELLGGGDGLALRDLLDPAVLIGTEQDLQRLTEHRRARNPDDIADLLRILGPLTDTEISARAEPDDVPRILADLVAARRVIGVRIGGEPRWADPADAAVLRDALGTALPPGIADAFLEPVADPLGRLLSRHARSHGPFTAAEVATRFGLGVAVVTAGLRRLLDTGRLVEGEFRPLTAAAAAAGAMEYVDAEVLRLLRRRSLAALRAEVEPVPAPTVGRFLPAWHGIGVGGSAGSGGDAVLRAVEQLGGALLPASAVESLILPARVPDYRPAMLDELMSAGEVLWTGHGALAGDDGWIRLHLAETAALTLPLPESDHTLGRRVAADPVAAVRGDEEAVDWAAELLAVLSRGGAFFFRDLSDAVIASTGQQISDDVLTELLWGLAFDGLVSSDTLVPLRARLSGGRTTHRTPSRSPRARTRAPSSLSLLAAQAGRSGRIGPAVRRSGPPQVAGRWSLIDAPVADPTIRAQATAELLLDRYGVVTRGSVMAEEIPGGFAAMYRVLAAFEETGRIRRGYFIEGLGAAQFAGAGAVDSLRSYAGDDAREVGAVVLAAADPANPYGAALDWPERAGDPSGHRPARRAGAMVVLVDGSLVYYAERGGRTLLSFTQDPDQCDRAAKVLADTVISGRIAGLTIARVDDVQAVMAGGEVVTALTANGFVLTPRGLRIRAGHA